MGEASGALRTGGRRRAWLGLAAAMHGLFDFMGATMAFWACSVALQRIDMPILVIAAYACVSAAGQAVAGLVADIRGLGARDAFKASLAASALALVLVALEATGFGRALWPAGFAWVTWAVVVALAVLSSVMHVCAGRQALVAEGDGTGGLGLFMAPGVAGIALAAVLFVTTLVWSPLCALVLAIAALALGAVSVVGLVWRGASVASPTPDEARASDAVAAGEACRPLWVWFVVLVACALTSQLATDVGPLHDVLTFSVGTWSEPSGWLVRMGVFAACAFGLAKWAGGRLADRFGRRRVAVAALAVVAALALAPLPFRLGNVRAYALEDLVSTLLVIAPYVAVAPVTASLAHVMGGWKGFAFALSSVAAFVGVYLPLVCAWLVWPFLVREAYANPAGAEIRHPAGRGIVLSRYDDVESGFLFLLIAVAAVVCIALIGGMRRRDGREER